MTYSGNQSLFENDQSDFTGQAWQKQRVGQAAARTGRSTPISDDETASNYVGRHFGLPFPTPRLMRCCAAATLLTVSWTTLASAQVAPPATAEAPSSTASATETAESSPQLQEIVVTAQKRGQNLQDVPISVTAFNETLLASAGVDAISDLGQVDPSLNFGANGGTVLPFLRGIGNPSGGTVGNESSVPIYIDDVYYSRLSSAYLDLANIERVEVLKGPQGTLFGRNASGGAIQVFTRDPGRYQTLEAKLGYGNFDTITGQLHAATPLGSSAGIDLSVNARHQGKGWGENIYNGAETYRNNFLSLRSKLVVRPTDSTTIRLIGFYVRQQNSQGVVAGRYRGTFGSTAPFYGPSQIVSAPSGFYDSTSTFNPTLRHRGFGGSLKVDQELPFAVATSITAYRHAKELAPQDGENTLPNYSAYAEQVRDRQVSQELQLKSKASSSISWLAGFFYLYSRQGYVPTTVTGDNITELQNSIGLPPAQGARLDLLGLQKINSYSGYGQTTIPVLKNTNVTLGARYTIDNVRGIGNTALVDTAVGDITFSSYNKSFEFKKFTYRVSIDQQITDRVNAYGSVSRGYKSGTFNTLPLDADPTRPETVDAYEIGLKTQFLDNRVRLNAAAFWNDIGNPQVQTVITDPRTGTSSIGLTNAEKARIRGFEVNADAALATGLDARFGATYLDAKYLDFPNAPFYLPIVNGSCPNGASAGGFAAGLCPAVAGDASQNRMVQVPKVRLSGGINYSTDFSFGEISADLGVAYTSSFFWSPDNFVRQPGYALINTFLSFTPRGQDELSIEVWAKNLNNRKYYSYELPVTGGAGNLAAPAEPRTFGVDVRIKL